MSDAATKPEEAVAAEAGAPEPAPAAPPAGEGGGDQPKKDKKKKKKKGGGGGGEGGERKPTAKELRKAAAAAAAAEAAAAKAAQFAALYGDAPMVQSQKITGRVWTRLDEISEEHEGKTILVRGRVHTSRVKGKCAFLLLRQSFTLVQGVLFQSKEIPKDMIKYADGIPKESVVDITATVSAVPEPIDSATLKNLELQIKTIHTVSRADPTLPFSLEDAGRSDTAYAEAEEAAAAAAAAGAGADGVKTFSGPVGQDLRLDHRWIDLRTPANQAIFRISSGVCGLFRDFLTARRFVEIQSPKIIGGASEGGSEVFTFKYFGRDACLAQSPQLYKQMVSACSDFERVFEIGPVFRAENSNTHRHLCEFHGLDMEMVFNEHYYEVLDVFSDLFIHIFEGLQTRFAKEIEAVNAQFPCEPFTFLKPALRLTFAEGIAMLQEAGEDVDPLGDLSTPHEKLLGKLVKAKYGTDFFMMDKYPMAVRPFYTMPDPENPALSNSYDFFMRGEEILSGAQRIHDPELLTKRALECGIPVDTIQGYVDSFKHGALPHGGGGVGLERVVMLFLGLGNIRKSALFPRDPKRLAP